MTIASTTHKFTIALRKGADETVLLESVAVAALRLGFRASEEDAESMSFLAFIDADGNAHDYISALSLIVMKGKASELRQFRSAAAERGVHVTNGKLAAQEDARGSTPATLQHSDFQTVIVFGAKEVVNPMTSKMSLWR
ncbi:DUF2000 family protein [Paraburkholderia sp. MM5482-R1]|uniref:DUF2000 family protein n=1 Tax=unclassified Paraburkholderia TaxID=2615204 RepID=UPI003D2446C1